jgi:hypothetical protein
MLGSLLKMDNQLINARIATDINGWTEAEPEWYTTSSGMFTPLPDYCNSNSHALDLAKASNIMLQPLAQQWRAISVDDGNIAVNHEVAATAIAMTALAIFDAQNNS